MWAGVDVGAPRKGFHAAVADAHSLVAGPVRLETPGAVRVWLRLFAPRVVAVDSPCSAAPAGCRSRACERDLARAICGIRYTPARDVMDGNPYYGWILNGLELYRNLAEEAWALIECFPTASFTRWAGRRGSRTRAAWSRRWLENCGFPALSHGQDGRDAVAAALTARCYDEGSFESFGEIIVPAQSA